MKYNPRNKKENPRLERYTFRLNQMENLKLRALLMIKVDVPAVLRKAILDEWERKSK